MKMCRDCSEDVKRTNRIWTTTSVVLALFSLGAGFLLGQLSVVG